MPQLVIIHNWDIIYLKKIIARVHLRPSSALVTFPPSCQGVFFLKQMKLLQHFFTSLFIFLRLLSTLTKEPQKARLTPQACLWFNYQVENIAYIALGSNLGDRELNLLRAVAEIGKFPENKVTGLSRFYETSPVGVTDQPSFYNAVLRLSTQFSPQDLLGRLQHIENSVFKRKKLVHWGPRTMDLDLLLYNDLVLQTENLVIPHPRMAERAFVLQPLKDIAPDLVHPVLGLTVSALLSMLQTEEVLKPI